MSMVMEAAMERWERGLSTIPDKVVCRSHFDDYAISRFIYRNGSHEKCDYCGKTRLVVGLEELLYFMTDALQHFYTDPANFMPYISSEGGYIGEVSDPWELLENLGLEVEDDELREDMCGSFDLSSGWSEEYGNLRDYHQENWSNFKRFVRNESRFLFSAKQTFLSGGYALSAAGFLKEISKLISSYKMVTTLLANTVLYRCRQHTAKNDISGANDICAPKNEFVTQPNRMSPAGISMFYGAFDIGTAKSETLDVRDLKRPFYSIAKFRTLKTLNLVDLSRIPGLPSAFDQEKWPKYYLIDFLHDFVQDFSKPISRDGGEHVEYVPTQILTEYFKYALPKLVKMPIDGIIYTSSKNRLRTACVLFMDHDQSLTELRFVASALKTYKF